MYWFRDGSALSLLPWLAVMLMAALGGWLLATHLFRLDRRERLIAGLGLGLVLYTWLANLLGQHLAPTLAFFLPAVLVLAAGLVAGARRRAGPWLQREDLRIWPWLLAGLALFYLFALWGKGLALFDEHKNLSLISIMANGDIPPHYAPNQPLRFIYHYGFQVFGASLMTLGGMMPWSAFDAAKAVMWALTLLLAGLLGRRYIGHAWGALAAGGLLALASGTRYLLFLLPPGILQLADEHITLQGTSRLIGAPFMEALSAGWPVDGGPAAPYIFGFLNGIMDPLVLAHQGPNTFSILILMLVWLLLTRLSSRFAWPVLAAVLAMWALAWEATYALFLLGLFSFTAFYYWRHRSLALPHLRLVLYAAALSLPIALVQGGTLTEMARNLIFGIQPELLLAPATPALGAGLALNGAPTVAGGGGFLGFNLRWPPAILSSHLGALSLFSPIELLVGLFEIGPVLLFTPWITRWAWRRAQAGDWALGVLSASAWIGFLMPIFLTYRADRDISRLSWQALLTWTIMLLFIVADPAFRWRAWLRKAAIASLLLVCVGGILIAGTQLTAANRTQLAHGFDELDAEMASLVWGRLPPNVSVFGPLGHTTILTGTLTGQLTDLPGENSMWSYPFESPDAMVAVLIDRGWDILYLDTRWLAELFGLEYTVQLPECVGLIARVWDRALINYRAMLDLRPCHE